jgi:hypothetical protein
MATKVIHYSATTQESVISHSRSIYLPHGTGHGETIIKLCPCSATPQTYNRMQKTLKIEHDGMME